MPLILGIGLWAPMEMDPAMRNRIVRTCLLISAFPATLGMAATILVPDHRSTIQAGIDAAQNGDVVSVRPGTYCEQIDFRGKAISVVGSPARKTVIDGSSLASTARGALVKFTSGEGSGSLLDGFTITGRDNGDGFLTAGGIYCSGSSPKISNCIVTGNSSASTGGGVACVDASPTLTNCLISNNSSDYAAGVHCFIGSPVFTKCTISENTARVSRWDGGAGLHLQQSDLTLANCTISDNFSPGNGGGLWADFHSSIELTNCKLSGNVSRGNGAAIYLRGSAELTNCLITDNHAGSGSIDSVVNCDRDSSMRMTYCTIADNTAGDGGAVRTYWGGETVLYGCIVWGNAPATISSWEDPGVAFSNIEGGFPGQGNIAADPQFASYRDFDYLLEAGSPCIDAGSAEIPDGIRWPSWYPNRGRSDMGAWGGPDAAGWLR